MYTAYKLADVARLTYREQSATGWTAWLAAALTNGAGRAHEWTKAPLALPEPARSLDDGTEHQLTEPQKLVDFTAQ